MPRNAAPYPQMAAFPDSNRRETGQAQKRLATGGGALRKCPVDIFSERASLQGWAQPSSVQHHVA